MLRSIGKLDIVVGLNATESVIVAPANAARSIRQPPRLEVT